MSNSAWILCLLIAWMRFSDASSRGVIERSSSSSSGAGVAPQTCGTDNFYCPYNATDRCKPRNQRCTESDVCNNPVTMIEEECSETSNPGEYYVFLGHAKLGLFGSRKRNIRISREHQFITFRGFTYEFGKSYGVQVLDIIDPIYKYTNGQGLNSNGIETEGSSYCSWEDANMVVSMWKDAKYRLFTNNCQHFAAAMSDTLLNGPCNRPENAISRGKRQDNNVELSQYIDQQLRNCSLVCCYDDSSATLMHNSYSWVMFIFVALTSFAFYV